MNNLKSKFLNKKGELMIRCSSLSSIMASPNKAELSVGAQTYVKSAFKQIYMGYEDDIGGVELDKGTTMEDAAIELLNLIKDSDWKKNELLLSNEIVKGTADIVTVDSIRDIKCSWSKKTFPLIPEDGHNTTYEWQLRGYMWLHNKDEAYLDYLMMTTPDTMIKKFEPKSLHYSEDLPLTLRHTEIRYERCLKIEQQITNRVEACREYFNKLKKLKNVK